MTTKPIIKNLAALLLATVALTGLASAQVLSVSMNGGGGYGTPTGFQQITNGFNASNAPVNTSNAFTGTDSNVYTVGITYLATGGYSGEEAEPNYGGYTATQPPNNFVSLYLDNSFENASAYYPAYYPAQTQGGITLSIAGVTAGETYQLTLWSYNEFASDTTTFTPIDATTGGVGTVAFVGSYGGLGTPSAATDTEDSTTIDVSSTTTTLDLGLTGASGNVTWNGFTLTPEGAPPAVPEPSTASLMILCGALWLVGMRFFRGRLQA